MRFVSIVGARPQFIKVAPLSRIIASHNQSSKEKIDDIIVHTGQHYDSGMSDIFFDELEIPHPTFNLEIGSGPHGQQTGRMLEKVEAVLKQTQPDHVIVYGDTNSTIGGALAAVKLHIPCIHVEAGLRSFNRNMPEEINRIATDHIADLLLAPTKTAVKNLKHEGLGEITINTGDIMHDAVLFNRGLAKNKSDILNNMSLQPGEYVLVTVHRAENTDDPQRLDNILKILNSIAEQGMILVFPIHPRTRKLIKQNHNDWLAHDNIRMIDPIGSLDMMALLDNAAMALTDSGGLQKEAFFLGCPCITLRDETEWVETVECGGNRVTGPNPEKAADAFAYWQKKYPNGNADFIDEAKKAFGAGDAAEKILAAILR
jgi:UDP-GlcNAc3NAcA epimerase